MGISRRISQADREIVEREELTSPSESVNARSGHSGAVKKSGFWQDIWDWLGAHKKGVILTAITLLVIGGVITSYVVLRAKIHPFGKFFVVKVSPVAPKAVKYFSPLTGLQVPDVASTKQEVTAIMIENSDWARPQSGLKQAGVVFEAIAEGGITRFAALYQEAKPQLIGPVRSLRQYYLDWIAAFDASIVHVGGSYYSLQNVRNGSFKDADEFFNGSYFWRATDRYAPHNVYTSFAKLDALNAAKGYTSSSFTGFPRKDDAKVSSPTVTKIDIAISSADFNVHYDYNQVCNCYYRSEGGKPHLDREEGQLAPKVVIAMKVSTQAIFQDGYREQMTTIGTGQLYLFQDGTITQGTWSKASQKGQLQFLDGNGKPISLNRGQVWITATPSDENITWQ